MVVRFPGPACRGRGGGVDLTITSIARDGDCTSLTWRSQPNQFYRIYWTDSRAGTPLWRIAAVNVPSGGDTTTWTEAGCSQTPQSRVGFANEVEHDFSGLDPEEMEAQREASQTAAQASADYLLAKLMEAVAQAAARRTNATRETDPRSIQPDSIDPTIGPYGTPSGTNDVPASTAKFYRVACTAVSSDRVSRVQDAGVLDGWGLGLGTLPLGESNIIAVSAGPVSPSVHNLALRADGTVLAWGDPALGANAYGQCDVPTNLSQVVAIAAGGRHSVALRGDGTVVLWGDNSLGQINPPPGLSNVVDVRAGCWHTLALKADGTVAAWGDVYRPTNFYQLSITNIGCRNTNGTTICQTNVVITNVPNGLITGWGGLGNRSTNLECVPLGLSNVIGIAAGPRQCLALLNDHTVRAWGLDWNFLANFQPSNVPAGLTNVIALSSAMENGLSLLRDGTIVPWGETNRPIMAVPAQFTNTIGIASGWHYGLCLDQDGTLFSWGQCRDVPSFGGVVAMSAGASHGLVVRTNVDAPVIRRHPISIAAALGTASSMSVVATSALALTYQWQKDGNDLAGQTNDCLTFNWLQDSDQGSYRVRVSTAGGSLWSQWAQVQTFTNPASELPLLPGQVGMWGDCFSGAQPASLIDEQPSWAGLETNLVAIAAGGYHSLGLREDGTVLQWNHHGAFETNVPACASNVVAVAAGAYHSLALRVDGQVVQWGRVWGQPAEVPEATDLVAIAAGGWHSLGLRPNGTVLAWGTNYNGCLDIPPGLSNVADVAAGSGYSLVLLSNGTLRSFGQSSYGEISIPGDLSNVVQIAAGPYHALALKSDGTLCGLGSDLGYGATNTAGLSNILQVSAGLAFSVALRNDGTVTAWGSGFLGATNVPAGLSGIKAVAAGGFHTLALAHSPSLDYPVVPSRDLMVVYNTNSTDSIFVKEYYRTNRPYVSDAIQFPIGGPASNFFASGLDYTNYLLAPLLDWYDHHPTLRPAYVICFMDVPSRFDPQLVEGERISSVSYKIRQALSNQPPCITYLNMGTRWQEVPYEWNTNATPDSYAYVNKLLSFGTDCSPRKLDISASAHGYGNTNYLLDDECRYYPDYHTCARDECQPQHGNWVWPATNGLLSAGVSPVAIDYLPMVSSPDVTNRFGMNLAGYLSWGHYGWYQDYDLHGQVGFYGNSSWYIMGTIESYNGTLCYEFRHHGQYTDWFSANAFGSTNYESTPVGAIANTAEPFGEVIGNPSVYLGFWASGKRFGTCAWQAGGLHQRVVLGDPFVKR